MEDAKKMTIQAIKINNIYKYIIVRGFQVLKTCDDLQTAKLYLAILRG